jgi:hypothetical protein
MDTDIPDAIAAAFQATLYLVFAPTGTITLRIDQHNPELYALMAAHGHASLAILTAHNPGARRASIAYNRRAQKTLRREVSALGLPCFYGRNMAGNGEGPNEPTVAIVGVPLQQAAGLARLHGQLAFVFAGKPAVPELVWV